MLTPSDTALTRHLPDTHLPRSEAERVIVRRRRAARRQAIRDFVAMVFAQAPRHPVPQVKVTPAE